MEEAKLSPGTFPAPLQSFSSSFSVRKPSGRRRTRTKCDASFLFLLWTVLFAAGVVVGNAEDVAKDGQSVAGVAVEAAGGKKAAVAKPLGIIGLAGLLKQENTTRQNKDLLCRCVAKQQDDLLHCHDFHDVSQLCLASKQPADSSWQQARQVGQTRQQQQAWRPRILRLTSSNMTSIVLTSATLVDRLGVRPKSLEEVSMTDTKAANISFCLESKPVVGGGGGDAAAAAGMMIPCKEFVNLRVLNLRDNMLTTMGETLPDFKALKEVWLSGNEWSCYENKSSSSHKLHWLLDVRPKIMDENETFCVKQKSNKWHQNVSASNSKFNKMTLVYFLEFHKDMLSLCPEGCQCNVMNINTPIWVQVSCANNSWSALPNQLPENTLVLDVSHNQLTDLKAIRTNTAYRHLKQLTANDNNILTMADLAGSPFLKTNQPTTLNLQYNELTEFDVNLLEPTLSEIKKLHFQDSLNFLFAGNPFDCGCDSLQILQNFVYEYKVLLRDADFLACGKLQNPVMISADYELLCQPAGLDYMVLVIVAEVLLLALVLVKLAYDTVHYQRTGELPWLARNICMGSSYGGLLKTGSRPCHPSLLCCRKEEETVETGMCWRPCRSRQQLSSISSDSQTGSGRVKKKKTASQLLDAFRPRRQTSNSRGGSPSEFGSPVSHVPATFRNSFKLKTGRSRGSQMGEENISLKDAVEFGHF